MITASIVLFKNDPKVLCVAIESFLRTGPNKLFLIDNSPTDDLKTIYVDDRVEYIHNFSNLGFGAAHNIAIKKANDLGSKYHFVLNPDVRFDKEVVSTMVFYMERNPRVGMMMPRILNEDETPQYLPKLLPSPYSILMRKFRWPKFLYNRFAMNYELRNVPNGIIYNSPVLSGCFTLFRIGVFLEEGGYDDRFFMYFEDWDLSRRVSIKYDTVYFPHVSVFHGYASGANSDVRLFKIFVKSAMSYFNKWGWFFDKDRRELNNKVLAQFKK